MARSFDGTSTTVRNVTSVPLTTYPFTFAGWVYPVSGSGAVWVLAIDNNTLNDNYFMINWATASGKVQIQGSQQGVAANQALSTTADTSLNVWKHICGTAVVSGANSIMTAYLNGGGKNAVTGQKPLVTCTFTRIASIGSNNFGGVVSRIADVGAWNVVLSDAEILALAQGARSYTIRPSALAGYWPLDGLQSPEPDLHGTTAVNLSLVGAPALAPGPPVMPFTPRWPQWLDVPLPSFTLMPQIVT